MKQTRSLVLCVVFAAFMARLDTNIISVALPTLGTFFHVQAATTANLMLSFLIVVTALLIPLGHLGDRIGFRTLLIAGYLLFTLGSLLCGVITGFTLLVAARAVQGVGAAMLMISAYSLVPQRLEPESVGKAMGWMAAAGRWADQIHPAIICSSATAGGALTSAIFTLFAYLGIYSAIYAYLFFLGLCLGAYLGPGAKLLLTGAPQVKQGTITGIFHTTNNLSLVIGVSCASLILHLGQKAADAELTTGLPGEPFLPLYLFNVCCFAAAAFMALKIKPAKPASYQS
ncbi:MAG: MFS transporter [Pseudomonadota bacterium]|nr:MFS transporter [Pseudomonadota bacterium]